MAATIAVLSQKGGTGKTTTVRTLTDVFRSLGLEVLAVDLDPQGNLSDYLDVDPEIEPTIGDVLTGRAKAADAVHDGIVPANLHLAEAEYFALQGVEQALEVVELARETLNPQLEWLGVLLNIADMRTIHSREAYANLREHYTAKVFRTPVRASIAYAEAAERAVSIIDFRPDLGADYLAVADEILARLKLGDARKRLQPMLAAAG